MKILTLPEKSITALHTAFNFQIKHKLNIIKVARSTSSQILFLNDKGSLVNRGKKNCLDESRNKVPDSDKKRRVRLEKID